jgi:tetratricopeptide (TPR) repeat protein
MSRALRAALAAAALAAATPASAGLAESWYLARGRANMKIANYGAAIEAYESALRANPRSREASRGLGVARERNGDTDRAVAEFDRHLELFRDDWEIAFEQARILQWSRYAYRSRDAIRYLRMGLAVHDDPARRRDLARLLARERATLPEALAEYDRLLERSPGDPALREERLKLLLWDPARRADAVRELEARVREHPDDERAERDLARLTAEDPARAAEAISRYDALLARRPQDAELHLGRARALVRAGRRAEARDAYARALALRPTAEARLERADLLAADPATRDAAVPEYQAALREAPRSRRARLGLARVLMSRRETSVAAVAHYEAILRESPRDAEAHRGLARAYAWNGDADRAVAHGDLARRYAPASPDPVDPALRRGREPTLGGGARFLAQPGGTFAVSSFAAFASASSDPTPFTSTAVEGGLSVHSRGGASAQGTMLSASGEWRPGPGSRLRLRFAWDGARLAREKAGGEIAYEEVREDRTLSIAGLRAPRQDSFRALAGEVVSGVRVGAASDDVVEARGVLTSGRDRFELSARAGAVTGAGFDPVFTMGGAARADREILRGGPWLVRVGASALVTHHARDLSGVADGDPLAPRIFSPPLFLAASPRVEVVREIGAESRFALDAGPALQLTTGPAGGVRLGGDLRASLARRVGEWLRLGLEGRAERVANVYQRYALAGTLAFVL